MGTHEDGRVVRECARVGVGRHDWDLLQTEIWIGVLLVNLGLSLLSLNLLRVEVV